MGMYLELYAVSDDDAARLVANTAGIDDLIDSLPEEKSLSLEKAWHGLHYLLSGSVGDGNPPLDFLLLGGEPIGPDRGYGPARLFPSRDVRELHAAVFDVSDEGLWSRFDSETMTDEGIYPGIWDEPEEDLHEEYLFYFRELKNFLRRAVEQDQAVVILLS